MATRPARLFAGSRTAGPGYVDAIGTAARFNYPACLCADDDYLYVTEWVGGRVRRIDPDTAQVTTAVTLPSGSEPFGITRGVSGNFYVACPGGTTSPSGGPYNTTWRIYDPSWSLIDELSTDGDEWVVWFVCPSPDESEVYAAGHFNDGAATFGSRFMRIDTGGSFIVNQDVAAIDSLGPNNNPGGIVVVGSDVYWQVTRGNKRIYRSGLTPTGAGDWTLARNFAGDFPPYLFDSGRQLHLSDDGLQLEVAFGPSEYHSSPYSGNGARRIDLDDWQVHDPALRKHAGQLDPTDPNGVECFETDYLHVFDKHFVSSTRLAMTSGFAPFEALSTGRHTIEVIGEQVQGQVDILD